MALTKAELIGSLQNEIRILVHLTTKVDPTQLDYRPTPKQRSTIELLRYLTMMGPELVASGKKGFFDVASWNAADERANALDFAGVVASLESQAGFYAEALGEMSEEDFATEIEIFGGKMSRGSFMVNMVLCAHAAYRTQFFCYLKSCGREDLSTMNLWAGMDAPTS